MTTPLEQINCAGITSLARRLGLTTVTLIAENSETGDSRLAAYAVGTTRVIETNGDPLWEEEDPAAFADMMLTLREL